MSLMNPEFRRNLWLELTPGRLAISILAVVSLLALAGVRDKGVTALSGTAEFLFAVVVFFWGGRLASDAVLQEISDRTWDNQRMSALGPWAMSWGKLFGAPICAWAAAVPALAVMAWIDGVQRAATYILLGVLCHAISLALSLQSIRKGRQHGRIKTLFFQFIALLVVLPFAYALIWFDQWIARESIYWFSWRAGIQTFALVSALLFSAWAVLAVYRQMRLELQKPTAPTAWLAFLLFLLLYQTGLVYGGSHSVDALVRDYSDFKLRDSTPFTISLVLAALSLNALTYLAIFTEPKSMIGLRQMADALRQSDWRRLWLHTPRWLVTLKLAALATVLVVLFVDLPATAKAADTDIARLAIAVFLFLLRNVGIVLLCNFIARSGRGDFAAVVILLVLTVVLPLMLGGAIPAVAALFQPPIEGGWGTTLVPILAQLVLIGGLLVRVFMQAEKQRIRAV